MQIWVCLRFEHHRYPSRTIEHLAQVLDSIFAYMLQAYKFYVQDRQHISAKT
jgi:hypothetical protein